MDPPPFPFWVERLPDSIAVSVAVSGACKTKARGVSRARLCAAGPARPAAAPHLDGLRDVHLVYLDLRKAAPRHIFVLFIITIKEVGGVYSNTNCSLRNDE